MNVMGNGNEVGKLDSSLSSEILKYSVCVQHVCLWSCRHKLPHTIVVTKSPAFTQFWFCLVKDTHSWTKLGPNTQFWQYNELTSPVKVTTFIVVVWPVHGPSQLEAQLTWLCRQCSKSSRVKLGILFSPLFRGLPLFCLHSRQLLSRRASHSSQILFSPFLLAVSVVFASLSHTVVKQVPLWSRTPPRAEFISLSSVCACMCALACACVCMGGAERKFVYVTSFPGCLTEWAERLDFGGRCKALSHPSTNSHWSAKSNDSLAAQYATHIQIHASRTAVCKQAHMRTLTGKPVRVIAD